MLLQEVQAGGLITVVEDDDAGRADDLAGVAVLVDLAQAGPLTEGLGVRDLDVRDGLLQAQRLIDDTWE